MIHGKEKNNLTCRQMMVTIKEDIDKLKITLLRAMTDDIEPEILDGKDIAEVQRKNRVRNIKNILKEKLDVMDLLDRVEERTKETFISK